MQALSQLSYTPTELWISSEQERAANHKLLDLAEWSGLEPATPGVTGWTRQITLSNIKVNYITKTIIFNSLVSKTKMIFSIFLCDLLG